MIYAYLARELYKKKNSRNEELIDYILKGIRSNSSNISQVEQWESEKYISHTSLILRFARWWNHQSVLKSSENQIKKAQSIFIFRTAWKDLSLNEITTITDTVREYNPKLKIFIDQEWGYVNRYVDFENAEHVDTLLWESFIKSRYGQMNATDQAITRGLFPKSYGYFPSLGSIGVAYDSISTKQLQKSFLEIMAYARLKSLKDNGINTYWLVADLNYGNPAISKFSRSFSKHTWKYKELIDAFIVASIETDISLYLKHFPWHGAWATDSHIWILDMTNNTAYLKENMEIFNYYLENKKTSWWLMVAHVLFDASLSPDFQSLTQKADYLLTDDLAMQWYKKICSSSLENAYCNIQNGVFSTKEILWRNNLIKVDTQYVENVY